MFYNKQEYTFAKRSFMPSVHSIFKDIKTFLDEKEIVKTKQLLVNSSTKTLKTRLELYKTRVVKDT